MLPFVLKFSFVHILFIISVNAIEPIVSNGYIGECLLTNEHHLTFICVSDFRQTNFFDTSTVSECSEMYHEFRKEQIVEINFENCTMSNIGKPIFEVYKSISSLNASHLELLALQKELFREAKNLTKLNASHNKIVELSSFLFVNAGNLSEADFSFNAIQRVDPFAFAGDLKLEYLNLSQNNIATLQKQLFDYLPKLKHLDVSHNALTVLGENIFGNLTDLRTLHLSFNSIEQLNINTFASLIKLRTLNLSNAKLSAISPKTFSQLSELQALDLSHNSLKVLDIRIFDEGIFLSRFDSLKLLSIGGNQLQELNGFSSAQCPDVKIAGLDENRFECCDFKHIFKSFNRKQLLLAFDENSNHPNVSDSLGLKCEFGNDSATDAESREFNWTDMLAVICLILVTLLFVIVISILTQIKHFKEFRTNAENIAIECRIRSNESTRNIYDLPKFRE